MDPVQLYSEHTKKKIPDPTREKEVNRMLALPLILTHKREYFIKSKYREQIDSR